MYQYVCFLNFYKLVFFFLNYRKLSSKSNTLHINLFIAFILRSILSFLKESLFVDGLGLEKDLDFVNGVPRFRQDESVSTS